MRNDWKDNLDSIKNRLEEIDSLLSKEVISVFPKNAEEKELIESLLSKMNIQYKIAS